MTDHLFAAPQHVVQVLQGVAEAVMSVHIVWDGCHVPPGHEKCSCFLEQKAGAGDIRQMSADSIQESLAVLRYNFATAVFDLIAVPQSTSTSVESDPGRYCPCSYPLQVGVFPDTATSRGHAWSSTPRRAEDPCNVRVYLVAPSGITGL